MDIREMLLQFGAKPVPHEIAGLGKIFLRRMTIGEVEEMRKEGASVSETDATPAMFRLVARFVSNEDGSAVFDASKPEDVAAMRSIPASAIADILNAGQTLNSLRSAPEGAEKKS